MKNDYGSIMHTKWQCQYHIMIIPEYRRQIIYEKYTVETEKCSEQYVKDIRVRIILTAKKAALAADRKGQQLADFHVS